jgi:CHAT domain-containing protein
MRERIHQLQRVLGDEYELLPTDRRQLAINTFSQELLLAEQQYQAFLDDFAGLDESSTKLFRSQFDEAATRTRLKPHEALIEYVVATDKVMIFVLTPTRLLAMTSPISQVNLHARLELLRDLLRQADNDRWKKPAASLSRSLLEPVFRQGWLEGVEHIYLVPHGMLNYLPFALLPLESPGSSGPLIEHYSLAYLPTASALTNSGNADRASRSVLAVAPVRSQLQHAGEEASSIAELFRPHSKILSGKAATESTFRRIAGEYQILHLATHGYFNKLNPLLSGLELEADEANDGLLEVHEILELKLNSDLVTLSACETGMGSGFFAEIPAGDDFVGMTRAFLQAGSASVLATLWEVDDRSTTELMKSFYTHLEESGAVDDRAVALADAQRALRSNEKYQHPYYWAPFVLVGAMNQQNHNRG